MGLDQSLYRRKVNGDVVEEIYWRKANFVHYFFTHDYLDRGFEDDDCKEFPVSIEDLEELKERCEKVQNGSDPRKLLPTMSGFFFGSTEYDDWYYEDIRFTKDEIELLLKESPLLDGEEFFYYAWY